ncbi:MAG: hypothetical protein CL946_13555 [Ectothiorhodospiraceae bacterium]|nr:hypothetical protein [Ectothiorhodospiraceae bacterium]
MKTTIALTLAFALAAGNLFAQSLNYNAAGHSNEIGADVSMLTVGAELGSGKDVILKAMKDELERNMEGLRLEDLKPPFYIRYEIMDMRNVTIEATLGAVLKANDKRSRSRTVRVMVGSYERTDENFLDPSSALGMFGFGGVGLVPLENDYYGIRRSLWMATDDTYRSAADKYQKKLAAIEQQNLQEDLANLPDFSKEEPAQMHIAPAVVEFDVSKWKKFTADVSAVFGEYPEIQASKALLRFTNMMVYYTNSEGTELSYPITLCALVITASTQAEDGEQLNDHLTYYTRMPDGLPDAADVAADCKELAGLLSSLRTAPMFDESYTGPVLFEGQAVAELFSQRYFMESDGFIATRDMISSTPGAAMFMGDKKSLEDRIGKRVLPSEMNLVAIPKTKEYGGVGLVGSYEIDRQGIVPQDRLVVVEGGRLQTLLNDRTPTQKVPKSTGHARVGIGLANGVAPSVIHVEAENGMSKAELKEELIQAASDEGLKKAVIVRKIAEPLVPAERDISPQDLFSFQMGGGDEGGLEAPLEIYIVDVATGEETLVRSASFSGISVSTMRKIMAWEDREFVYNTMVNPSFSGNMGRIMKLSISRAGAVSGFPASFIVPNAVLFEELDMKREEKTSTPKLPIVSSPLNR